ncbi:MAG: hypothetical protein F4Y42_06060 [Caldilineaceae bacterium SB0664_bin_27]|uniref:CN hydrolase domain-containing protein n=1 Tax=Caldilineaceae bacterium SB0664_bin_27 TaxID=2605260 RepID=A0A6B0YSK8_9CHLR|nr:hypothetical protein [Caldilineaceae bacterium SB0664_bin_27]
MKTLTVACIQQKMRLPQTLEEYREDLRRFLRAAENKRARLVVFPELAGVMVIPPLLGGFQANLLKRADLARRRQTSLWQKFSGGVSGALAGWLNSDFRQMTGALLTTQSDMVWEAYDEVFGGLAQEFDVTLVAPSAYLPDPLDGVLRNLAVVYGPGGERLGYQAKRVLHPEDEDLAQPGHEWNVIPTPVGRIGLMLGGDLLYPEVGRLLAYQGAELLIAQGAATERVLFEKLRAGILARMQDNQLFAAISFLVGHNEFSRRQRDPFVGRSSVLAPQELTPRASGILVESSNFRSESVLSAVWDFEKLAELWETSDTPVRSQLPLDAVGPALAQLYNKMNQLPEGSEALLAVPEVQEPETKEHPVEMEEKVTTPNRTNSTLSLDDLPVLSSVTSYWGDASDSEIKASLPAHVPVSLTPESDDWEYDETWESDELQELSGPEAEAEEGMPAQSEDPETVAAKQAGESQAENEESEEETQEMDALLAPGAEDDRDQTG